ncbi:serine hydrolase [soil metagenome]
MILHFLVLLLSLVADPTSAPTSSPSTAPVAGIVIDRVAVDRLVEPLIDGEYAQSIVVAIVDSSGTRVFGYGRVAGKDSPAPDGQTVYEIGSVSKVFTSLLLSAFEQDKLVNGDDEVQNYLPADVKLASKGRPITLLDLSTHRSGLPRMPANFSSNNPDNPYAEYDAARLFEFLRAWQPDRPPGDRAEYSNLGVGLLGYVLATRARTSYEQQLLERICQPLAMHDTSITLSDSQNKRLAPGHDADGQPAGNWSFTDTFNGAGGIRSTANDMARFVIAQFDLPAGKLGEAIRQTHSPQGTFQGDRKIGMAWLIDRDGECIWHNGQTGGYHSFVAVGPAKKVGVVVLCNTATTLVDNVGSQLIRKQLGVAASISPPLRKSIVLSGEQLDRFVGDYRLAVGVMEIRRGENGLTAKLADQPAFPIYFDSEKSCFWKVVDARMTFEFGEDGFARSLTLHQNGANMPAKRIDPTTKP